MRKTDQSIIKTIFTPSALIFMGFGLFILELLFPQNIRAQNVRCAANTTSITAIDYCTQIEQNVYNQFQIKVSKEDLRSLNTGSNYNFIGSNIDSQCLTEPPRRKDTTSSPDDIIFTFPSNDSILFKPSCLLEKYAPIIFRIYNNPTGVGANAVELCRQEFRVTPNQPSCRITVTPKNGSIGDVSSQWEIYIDNIEPVLYSKLVPDACGFMGYVVSFPRGSTYIEDRRFESIRNITTPYTGETYVLSAGKYSVTVSADNGTPMCAQDFNVSRVGETPVPIPTATSTPTPTQVPLFCAQCAKDGDCTGTCATCPHCAPVASVIPVPSLAPLCNQLPTEFQAKCWDCQNLGKLWTAIGCIPTDFSLILKDYVFVNGLGIAGGIAFLYFLYGVFLIMTSSGVAEKITEGREIIISALSGLLLIIFSIFLLRVIGVDILRLPGFS